MTQKLLVEFKRDIQQLQLQPSTGGCFEVSLDGKKIYSKLETRRFPEYEEIQKALKTANQPR